MAFAKGRDDVMNAETVGYEARISCLSVPMFLTELLCRSAPLLCLGKLVQVTPLQVAVCNLQVKAVEFLLSCFADVTNGVRIQDGSGEQFALRVRARIADVPRLRHLCAVQTSCSLTCLCLFNARKLGSLLEAVQSAIIKPVHLCRSRL